MWHSSPNHHNFENLAFLFHLNVAAHFQKSRMSRVNRSFFQISCWTFSLVARVLLPNLKKV